MLIIKTQKENFLGWITFWLISSNKYYIVKRKLHLLCSRYLLQDILLRTQWNSSEWKRSNSHGLDPLLFDCKHCATVCTTWLETVDDLTLIWMMMFQVTMKTSRRRDGDGEIERSRCMQWITNAMNIYRLHLFHPHSGIVTLKLLSHAVLISKFWIIK